MIVVDTNLIAYLLIPGVHTAVAERIYLRDPEWAAPLLWRSELRNVLVLHGRSAGMPLEDAFEVMRTAERLLGGREYQAASDVVLGLAWGSGVSAYDCEFVAVSRTLAAPLVTFDRRIVRRFPKYVVAASGFARSL